MQNSKSRAVVIATALLVGGACVASQPAIAKDPTGSIDSREIKNGTIRVADLNSLLKTRVAQAKTALQEIPDDSVTTPKLADSSVTGPKIADDSVTGPKIADDAVGASELANGSVDGLAVVNGSLTADDVASVRGVTTLDFPSIPAGSCLTGTIGTGKVLDNDLILVTPGPTMPGIVSVEGRQQSAGSATMVVLACNHAAVALNPAATAISWAVFGN